MAQKQLPARGPQKKIVKALRSRGPTRSAAVVAFADVTRNSKPRFSTGGDGSIVVNHTEFIHEVRTDALNVFAYDVYNLDLANIETFPWLAYLAQLFEDGRLEQLEVIFKSCAPTDWSGLVELGIDYDASDDVENVTERALLNWEGSIETNVWNSAVHRSTPKNLSILSKDRFQGDDGTDNRLSSFGNLFVATTTTNGSTLIAGTTYSPVTVGHLYLRYRVRLSTPIVPNTVGDGAFRNDLSRALNPQIAQKFSVPSISSTSNALAGMESNANLVVELEDPSGLKIALPETINEYLDMSGAATATTSTPLLMCDRDVDGIMSFTMGPCAALGSTTPSASWYTKTDLQNNGMFGNSTPGSPMPDANGNIFDLIETVIDSVTHSIAVVARIYMKAGTAMRLAVGGYNAVAAVSKALTVTSGRRAAYDRIELFRTGVLRDGVNRPTTSTASAVVRYD